MPVTDQSLCPLANLFPWGIMAKAESRVGKLRGNSLDALPKYDAAILWKPRTGQRQKTREKFTWGFLHVHLQNDGVIRRTERNLSVDTLWQSKKSMGNSTYITGHENCLHIEKTGEQSCLQTGRELGQDWREKKSPLTQKGGNRSQTQRMSEETIAMDLLNLIKTLTHISRRSSKNIG